MGSRKLSKNVKFAMFSVITVGSFLSDEELYCYECVMKMEMEELAEMEDEQFLDLVE